MIIDTSVYLAFYHKPDVHHEKAVEIMRGLGPDQRILISDLMVNELLTVAMRKASLDKSKEILNALLNSQNIFIHHTGKAEFYEIAEIFARQKSGLSFVDCSIIWLSRFTNSEVATFDKNLLENIHSNK